MIELQPIAEVQTPLEAMLGQLEDPWLRSNILKRLAQKDLWQELAALGSVLRLRDRAPAHPDLIPQLIQGIKVALDPLDRDPRLWATKLDKAQIDTIGDLLLAELDLLTAFLDDLKRTFNPEGFLWLHQFESLLERREDVAGVHTFLVEHGTAEPTGLVINMFDHEALRFVRSFPVEIAPSSERLARVRRLDPTAWWGFPP